MSQAPSPSPLATPEPWDLVADDYTAELLPMFEHFARAALELARARAQRSDWRGARVLDVATGPGTLALLAAQSGARVTAVDFSEQMLENLKRRASDAPIEVVRGDGQALTLASGAFDAAFSMFGLMFFPDRSKGFAELERTLNVGGVAVVSSWAPFEGVFKTTIAALREELPDIPLGSGNAALGEPEGFASELAAAGFEAAKVEQHAYTTSASSARSFWESCERTTAPIVLLRRRLGNERWQPIAQKVLERLECEHGAGPVEFSTTAYLGSGLKHA
jgi:ubiquinone/menaquinone biosynthesis C-methylase UbiE